MIAAVRRLLDAFNRGDFEAVVQLAHPDFELVRRGGMSSVKGIAALREWMARLGDDPTTVLSTYAHLLPQSDELAAERVAAALAT